MTHDLFNIQPQNLVLIVKSFLLDISQTSSLMINSINFNFLIISGRFERVDNLNFLTILENLIIILVDLNTLQKSSSVNNNPHNNYRQTN